MDLTLNTATDIVKLLCNRLRKERLARQMTQADVAARSGVGVNTVSNLETGKNVGFENLVKVAMVLGYGDALEGLFKPRIDSLDDILRYEKSAARQRIKRKNSDA
ncbi:helix-turn-helix domain-containing protein [Citrobacter portucalensis]|uniref:helix-turn-helix domain-containing protein n=1 Tax=Citrobacter portucalensis TaxID=1639133 RepID=UPI001BAC13DA|nr:helix-turn-helix transcriptional regulator [Citrobacter portucalensis]MCW8353759.1 helix-turn-helix transcriptional regulator [Citrobacter portucalensis]MCX8994252.1 helix-turn-helix transcriptional regulator [Citrobacter portucalensis]MCX9044263.1 helix-turn-helix transcriptional regulator [Citrobacter portucalensis]MCX9053285.1 helix-turn-helix transcriptional regulator [Citrobacter portucalensis]MCX9058515.1 helix-turn-helix transcriptional regulator [Citrobacter portucalensis]